MTLHLFVFSVIIVAIQEHGGFSAPAELLQPQAAFAILAGLLLLSALKNPGATRL